MADAHAGKARARGAARAVCARGGGGGGGRGAAASSSAIAALALLDDLGAQHERDVAGDAEEDDEDAAAALPGPRVVYEGANAATTTPPPVLLLPGPFAARPRRGTRRLCTAVLGGMVGAACAELSTSWQDDVRWRSAALMAVALVVAERGADPHLPTVVPALCRAVAAVMGEQARSSSLSPAAALRWSRRCAEVLGCFCDGEVLWSLLQPLCATESGGSGSSKRAAAVLVLASAVRGAQAATAASTTTPSLLARRALEMAEQDEGLRQARDVGLAAAVRELAAAATMGGGG